MCKNIVEPDGPRMTIWHMRTLWWITKATDTNPAYEVLTAFQLQQWLYERVPVLCYTYLACLVITIRTAVNLEGQM